MIYTSGLGGAFPRGIPIGSVLRELKTAEGWTRTYLLQPSVNPAKVNTVMVLTSQRSGQKMDNVWQMVARVDSAARSVANAGDSISRRAAADSAKRAAADSTRKVGVLHPAADSAARADSAKRSAAQTDSAARADSARAARAARREAARRDSIRRDAARRDSIRRDSIRRDTTRRDTTRRDTTTRRP
jgi:hypothetical protein